MTSREAVAKCLSGEPKDCVAGAMMRAWILRAARGA